jgi:magnesium transporter
MLDHRDLQTNFQRPVRDFLGEDFATVEVDWTISRALAEIRARGLGDRIIYFYVVDAEWKLLGVLPTRRLLTEPLDRPISEIMIKRVVAVPETATLLDACEFFVLYKFYALPVVDAGRRIVGVIDVGLFTEQVLSVEQKEEGSDDIFQTLGFHVEELRNATPTKAFRYRFPWLLATVGTGLLCAVLAGAYAHTLEQRIVLAFFMTLVLGLGESVGAQSMAVTLQAIHTMKPNLRWFLLALKRELATAAMLGGGCAVVAGAIIAAWQRDIPAAIAIAASILCAMLTACLLGLIVPSALRAFRLDPKIASGPVTLAAADVCTLLWYFGIASLLLTR